MIVLLNIFKNIRHYKYTITNQKKLYRKLITCLYFMLNLGEVAKKLSFFVIPIHLKQIIHDNS